MNSISWFLYLADVLEKITIIGAITALVLAIGLSVALVLRGCHNDAYGMKKEDRVPYAPVLRQYIWVVVIAIIIAIIPSKNTMYLIAGSEITEVVVNTPEAKEVLNETRDAILRTIKGISKE